MTAADRLDAIEARAKASRDGSLEQRQRLRWSLVSTDVPALVAALRGVMEVHAPEWTPATGWRCQECHTPLTDDTPDCLTVRPITAALTEVTA